ncbi:UNVERIFIED_CONTAM: hypothetical protein Slati_1136100 [Sesamum latifolium]|uniref:Integrase catalytic domain-containing protein n=1 Tax=Sesamum latifolium TaxID=2727402 RepID=A0AAW2XD99_9LAMI
MLEKKKSNAKGPIPVSKPVVKAPAIGKGKRKKVPTASKAEDACHYCHEKGHQKRNCPKFLVSVQGQSRLVSYLLDLIHSNVCRPFNTQARCGFIYFITFTDAQSQYGYVYLMKCKSEAFEKLKEFRLEVENQTGHKIKTLRSDQGGEYLSGEFLNYLKRMEFSQWTPPGTPPANSVSKRGNGNLLDMVRSMMSFTELPLYFWDYALEMATKLLNMALSKTVAKTLCEILHGKPASYKYLKVWRSPRTLRD